MLKNLIKNNLLSATRVPIDDTFLQRAAVVIAIIGRSERRQSPCFLLTRRATKMRTHAGQFALPGGKLDFGESAAQAALRELQEELGISADANDVLGLLDDYPTRSGFCITPVVVWLAGSVTITSNPDEVAKVFHIPLQELASENLVNLDAGETPDRPLISMNLATIGHEIYAPTAAIIYQFYELALNKNNTRVAHYDEPKFAWK